MPELPEVEAVRRRLEKALKGRRIARVEAPPDPIVLDGTSPERLVSVLRGRRVEAVRRKGKHFFFALDRRPWPLFHFGMTGWFHVDREDRDPPRRFTRLRLEIEGGTRVVFTDPRRFGRIRLSQDPLGEPPLSKLGFDVLDELPTAAVLAHLVARRKAPLKAVLLDQSLFAGIGNWIADEVLYQARLSPLRLAASLGLDEVKTLRARLHGVVKRAVDVGADSDRFPRHWLFHDRWGRMRDARTARGEAIVHDTVGGRTTAWVPAVQK
ncbi:MAG: Fpg/Nei family DNA glycosylase [bacterium]